MEIRRIFGNVKFSILSVILLLIIGILYGVQSEGSYDAEKVKSHVETYDAYLDSIIYPDETIRNLNTFHTEESDVEENIEKTSQAYKPLENVEIEAGNYEAISTIANFEEMHYVFVIYIFALVWNFFEDEKKGLKTVIYGTANGRGGLAVRRIGTIVIGTAGFVFLAYILVYSIGFLKYGGWEDIFHSIQSVPEFRACTYVGSIFQFMVHMALTNAVITIILGIFLWMMLLLFKDRMLSFLGLILFFAMEFLLYYALADQSAFVFFKYNNLYYFINPMDMMKGYENYKILGKWFHREGVFWTVAIIIGGFSAAFCIGISSYRKTIAESGRFQVFLKMILEKLNCIYHRIIASLHLFGLECYKVMICQKGILVVAVWIFILLDSLQVRLEQSMATSPYMKEVYQVYQGVDDGRLSEYIEKQTLFFETLDGEYEKVLKAYEAGTASSSEVDNMSYKVVSYQHKRDGLVSITNQLQHMKNMKEERGIDIWFMEEKPYKIMWTGDGRYEGEGYGAQQKDGLLSIFVLIFLIPSIFSYDRSCGMDKLIHATAGGRKKLFSKKAKMIVLLSFLVIAVPFSLKLFEVHKIYGLTCMGAPIQSLSFMKDYPLHVSILSYLIILFCIQFMGLLSVSFFISAIAMIWDGFKAMLVSFALLVIPSVLDIMGFLLCKKISIFQAVVYVECLQENGFAYSMVLVFVVFLVGFCSYQYVRTKWCGIRGDKKYETGN